MKDLDPLLNKLIAHRGIHNKNIKENSIEAIEMAVIKRVPVEFDITLTLDNIIVLSHNSYIKYDNKKILISINKYQYLKSICHNLVKLEDVLNLVKGRIPLLIELKPYNKGHILEKQLIKILDNYNGYFAVQSFNPFTIYWFKKNREYYIRGQLLTKYDKYNFFKKYIYKYMIFNKFTKPDFICYNIKGLPNKQIEKIRKNKKVIGWTIKNEEELIKYMNYCDNFICDNIKNEWRKYESKL